MVLGQDRVVLVGTWSVEGGTGWFLVILGQYGAVLVGTWWYWVSIKLYWVSKVLVSWVYWKKWRFGQQNSGLLSLYLHFIKYEV